MDNPAQLCVLCGNQPATTREHVPPHSIFPKPKPADLITVPACSKCNHGTSREDEKFRTYLSLHVGLDTPATQALWSNHALRTLRHNRKLKSSIVTSMRPVYFRTGSGIITGKGYGIKWDSQAHKAIMEKIIRGLYFVHSGTVLPPGAEVKSQWLKELPKGLPDFATWPSGSSGGNAFQYKYSYAAEDPKHSVWVFCFYGRHWASGYTSP